MDGFKTLPKMQAFKEGGHAKAKAMCWGGSSSKKMKEGGKADIEQDKKMIKKAFKQHDKAEHDKGEPTEIKLKKGGRSKKAEGTVKKFKTGGAIGVYGAKKKSGDLDSIEKAKDIKPKKAAAPSKASTKPAMKGSDIAKEKSKPAGTSKAKKVSEGPKMANAVSGAKEMPNKYKKGGKIKKMAEGKSVDNDAKTAQTPMSDYDKNRQSNIDKLGPAQKEEFAKQQAEATTKYGTPAKKKGGKIKKMADGGLTADQQSWMGGADQTDPFIRARMNAALGTSPSSAMSGYQGDIADMDTPPGNPSQQDMNGGGMPSEQDMNGGSYNGKQAFLAAPAPVRRKAAQPSFMQRVGKAFSNLGSSYSNQPGIYKKGGKAC